MKTKLVSTLSLGVMLLAATFSVTSAEEIKAINVRLSDETKVEARDNATSTRDGDGYSDDSTNAGKIYRGNATSSDKEDNNKEKSDDKNIDKNDGEENDGQINADEHRSSVSLFVKSLLKIADRDGGIGEQVREVAKAQNESASTTQDAIVEVENKGKFETFLFGSDYKNLGKLRTEVVKTENDITKLNNLAERAVNSTVKTELEAQIKALEDARAKVDAFIKAHENSFSLFGWLIRPFVK